MRSLIILLTFLLFSCESNSEENKIAIVIHGGAGTILKENMTPELETAYLQKLEEAVKVGYQILKNGGSSQSAVEETIKIMENSPLFNAGVGAVLTNDETVSLDASFMEGANLNAGAIAGSKYVKNPISAAISVMEDSPHVLLSSEGADEFAIQKGLDTMPNSYFITERRLNSVRRVKENDKLTYVDPFINDSKYGTVGCVAIDINGNISSGTSTGGPTNKKWGRIGDSPIIGSGTYANNNTCGISSTGSGEYFIRTVAAYQVSSLLENHDYDLNKAMSKVIHEKIGEIGGDGGMIGIDKNSNIVMDFNTPGMYRAYVNKDGQKQILLYKN